MKKVFISYSWDSPEHQNTIFNLSNKLRSDGIDCDIDQYHQSPTEGWPKWMEKSTRESDYVLIVCTETYLQRFEGKESEGKGQGIKWESLLSINDIYYEDSENTKYVPVIVNSTDNQFIPRPIKGTTYYDLSTEGGYENLYRLITGQPRRIKPELGEVKKLSPDEEALPELKRVWEEPPPISEPIIEEIVEHKTGKKIFTIGAIFAFIFATLQIAPNLSATLKFFGFADNIPDIVNSENNTETKKQLFVTPKFANTNDVSKNRSLKLTKKEFQEKCIVEGSKVNENPLFTITCNNDISKNLVHFIVEVDSCTPQPDKAYLGSKTSTTKLCK